MKSLFGILVFTISVFVFHGVAAACSCVQPKAPAEELKRAAAVFSATVREIKRHKADDPFSQVEVTFTVIKQWKGNGRAEQVVFTASHSAACGYRFERAKTYLVYAHKDQNGRLVTSICGRTAKLKDAESDIKELDRAVSADSGQQTLDGVVCV